MLLRGFAVKKLMNKITVIVNITKMRKKGGFYAKILGRAYK